MRKQHTEVKNLPEVTQLKSDLPVWVWASSRQPGVLKSVLVKCLGVRELMRLRVRLKETKKILWCPGISSSRELPARGLDGLGRERLVVRGDVVFWSRGGGRASKGPWHVEEHGRLEPQGSWEGRRVNTRPLSLPAL